MALIRNVAINSFCNDNFCGLSAFMRHRNEREREREGGLLSPRELGAHSQTRGGPRRERLRRRWKKQKQRGVSRRSHLLRKLFLISGAAADKNHESHRREGRHSLIEEYLGRKVNTYWVCGKLNYRPKTLRFSPFNPFMGESLSLGPSLHGVDVSHSVCAAQVGKGKRDRMTAGRS